MEQNNFKYFLKLVPGFRSNKTWKKLIACIYYSIALLIPTYSIALILSALSMPFVIFYLMEFIKNLKKKSPVKKTNLILLTSSLIFFISSALQPNYDNKAVKNIENVDGKARNQISSQKKTPDKIVSSDNISKSNMENESIVNREITEEKSTSETENISSKSDPAPSIETKVEESPINLPKENKTPVEEVKKVEEKTIELNKEVIKETTSEIETKNTSTSYTNTSRESQPATQTGQGEVFVTPTGKKYHSRACGKGNYKATTLADAESRGLTPCSKCY